MRTRPSRGRAALLHRRAPDTRSAGGRPLSVDHGPRGVLIRSSLEDWFLPACAVPGTKAAAATAATRTCHAWPWFTPRGAPAIGPRGRDGDGVGTADVHDNPLRDGAMVAS